LRKRNIILLLLIISWPLSLLDRLWNGSPVNIIHPFVFAPEYWKDVQWFVHDLGYTSGYICILCGLWIYANSPFLVRTDKGIKWMFKCVFVLQICDLPHYILWAKHNEIVLFLEGAYFLYCSLQLFFNGKRI
jgi:hypothetical protein